MANFCEHFKIGDPSAYALRTEETREYITEEVCAVAGERVVGEWQWLRVAERAVAYASSAWPLSWCVSGCQLYCRLSAELGRWLVDVGLQLRSSAVVHEVGVAAELVFEGCLLDTTCLLSWAVSAGGCSLNGFVVLLCSQQGAAKLGVAAGLASEMALVDFGLAATAEHEPIDAACALLSMSCFDRGGIYSGSVRARD